jgi:hypothetical protein
MLTKVVLPKHALRGRISTNTMLTKATASASDPYKRTRVNRHFSRPYMHGQYANV